MPRIRSIHPDICVSETMAHLGANLERTFLRLLVHCDDKGRCRDSVKLIKAAIYPLHDEITAEVLDEELWLLEEDGLITRYGVNGKGYIQVCSWDEYQHPQKPTPSKYPAPDVDGAYRSRTSKESEESSRIDDYRGEGSGGELGEEGSKSSKELSGKPGRRLSKDEQWVQDHTEKLEPAIASGEITYRRAFEEIFNLAFDPSTKDPAPNPHNAGRAAMASYFEALLERSPSSEDWPLFTRLVKDYGRDAFHGLAEALNKAPDDWFAYARGVCKNQAVNA